MSKAEDYIRKNTNQFSNEDGFDYVPWLTPDQARKAVEIAREEVIEETAEWLTKHVMNFFVSIDYNKETIAKLAIEQADALIKELRGTDKPADVAMPKHPKDDLLNRKLIDFPFSVRSLNLLTANDIITVRDLVKLNKTDWLKFRNGGKKSLMELDDFITEHNLSWGMNV